MSVMGQRKFLFLGVKKPPQGWGVVELYFFASWWELHFCFEGKLAAQSDDVSVDVFIF